MKHIFTLLTVLISINCFAQKDYINVDSIEYSKRIDFVKNLVDTMNMSSLFTIKDNEYILEYVYTSNYNAKDIYTKAKIWVSTNFNSGKAVLELDDKENSHITGNYISGDWIKASFDLQAKDHKFRIRFFNIYNAINDPVPIHKILNKIDNMAPVIHDNWSDKKKAKEIEKFKWDKDVIKIQLYTIYNDLEKTAIQFSSFINSDAKKDDF